MAEIDDAVVRKLIKRMDETGYRPETDDPPRGIVWILHPVDLRSFPTSEQAVADGVPLRIFGMPVEIDETVPPGEFRLRWPISANVRSWVRSL